MNKIIYPIIDERIRESTCSFYRFWLGKLKLYDKSKLILYYISLFIHQIEGLKKSFPSIKEFFKLKDFKLLNPSIFSYYVEIRENYGNNYFILNAIDSIYYYINRNISKANYYATLSFNSISRIKEDYIIEYIRMLLRNERQFNILEHNNSHYEKILKTIINSDIDSLKEIDICQLKDISEEYYNIEIDLYSNKRILVETIRREFDKN